jgi:hypothetical protein
MAQAVNLTGTTHPALAFWHMYGLETSYDFGVVEISTDGGAFWNPTPLARYTGSRAAMVREQIDLTAFTGQANLKLRFRLETDSSVILDGWYVDDVRVAEVPAVATLSLAATPTPTSVSLSWTASAAANFASYRIYRSLTPNVDWHTASLVTEITTLSTVAYKDVTVSPKTPYYYRIMVLDSDGMHSLSAELAVNTPAGMDFPFFDNGEGGAGTWLATPPWGLSNEDAFSGTMAWSDSPGGDYTNGIASQALTLISGMVFSNRAVSPVLCFVQRFEFASGDSGNVEVSGNNGVDWTLLRSYTGISSNWGRQRVSLVSYTNSQALLVRFRLTSDSSGNANGWHLDDIAVGESPAVVQAPLLDQVTSTSIRVNWSPATNDLCTGYAVYRSTSTGVGLNSTLAAVVPSRSQVSLVDTNLALDTVYYYRVYSLSSLGLFSPDSDQESSARTLNNPTPIFQGFESGLAGWNVTGSWAITTNNPHSGSRCVTDSPGGLYDNSSDSTLLTAVNLVGTTNPVLRFWDRYQLGSGDWCRLEVSSDGSSWSYLYGLYTGEKTNWTEHVVDLTGYRGQPNVRIRFHFWSDSSGTGDGWHLDDIQVAEVGLKQYALPFFEGFERGLSNWFCANWGLETNQPYGGGYAVNDTPGLPMIPDGDLRMWLNGEMNLTNTVNPQLTYWVRGGLYYRSYFRVYASVDGGYDWTEIDGFNSDWSGGWQRRQVSLASFINRKVRLIFRTWSIYGSAPGNDLVLDNISVQDPVPAVSLLEGVPHLSSIDLNWSMSALGNRFRRYEVYRSTGAGVSLSSTLVGSFTNASTTSMTDTNLLVGSTYYYRVYAVDTNDTYMPSNERYATTVPQSFPVSDDMDTMASWTATGNWGVGTNAPLSGTGYLTESPVGDYPNSHDSYLMTSISLAGTTNPVLRFSDRYKLASGDWCRLEVSSDGSSWSYLYGLYTGENTNWTERAVDLTGYRGQSNVRVRFHFWSDGSGTQDGWAIDKFLVQDRPLRQVPFPFFDGFENGMSNWIGATWSLETNQPYAGAFSANDTPNLPMIPDGDLRMWLNGEMNLTNTVNPQLTYWVRGGLYYRSYFRVCVSEDGGYNWTEIDGFNSDWSGGWTKRQVSLAGYVNKKIRLIFRTWSIYGTTPGNDLVIDNIGIGEWTPSAPSLNAPAHLSVVGVNRPTLTVNNAVSFQGSPLSYRFEVYSDASLSNLASQVPVVAAGSGTTSWQVDVDLRNNTQYWWRSRASDGTNIGPWSGIYSFYVNETNNPPRPVVFALPAGRWIMADLSGVVAWYPTTDPDEGDWIRQYHLQVDNDPSFASPEIDQDGLAPAAAPASTNWIIAYAMNSLPGATNLVRDTIYYCRIRAKDSRYLYSSWSVSGTGGRSASFSFAPALHSPTITGFTPATDGSITLRWTGADAYVYVEYSPTLVPPNWQRVSEVINSTNTVLRVSPGGSAGFYRLIVAP